MRLVLSLLLGAGLAACAAEPTDDRAAARPERLPWLDLFDEPVVEYRVDELCYALEGGEPRCVGEGEATAAAHLGVADGDVELHVTDLHEMRYVGRFSAEVERTERFELHATWPLDEGRTVLARDALVRAPVIGRCASIEQRQLGGRCEENEHTTACTMTSIAAETPRVHVARVADTLRVTFEAAVGDLPSRCCEPAVGCDLSERGRFTPERGVVRGELSATRAP